MNEIMQKLQNLDTGEPDTSTTPDQGVKEAHLCHKMSKVSVAVSLPLACKNWQQLKFLFL